MKLRPEQILPAVSTVLNIAICIGYAIQHDVRQSLYWLLCALITVVVAY
jgi:hypothetical protein